MGKIYVQIPSVLTEMPSNSSLDNPTSQSAISSPKHIFLIHGH